MTNIIKYYKTKYNDKKFNDIPKSIIKKCKTYKEVDEIAKKWNIPLKKSVVGRDKYVFYPLNPDGSKTGGSTYGSIDDYDDQNDW